MNAQEIFDTVVRHLRAQGAQAVSCIGGCVYRNELGLKCAVGCLISDEDYSHEMEGGLSRLFTHFGNRPSVARLLKHHALLSHLQTVHDNPDSWDSTSAMREGLRNVAKHYSLSTTVIDECFPAEENAA